MRSALHWMVGAAAVAVIAGTPDSASAVAILSRDFQSDTVGSNPLPNSGSTLYESSGNNVEVVGPASTPADPFGGVGNQSLLITAAATGNNGEYVMAAPGASAGPVGSVSMNYYQRSTGPAGPPVMELKVGAFTGFAGGSQTGPWMIINGATNILVFTPGPTLTLDQTVSLDAAHTFAIHFDANTDTFTATLDGNPLTDDGGATTSFPFFSSLAGVHGLDVIAPSSSRTGQVFLDNVTINIVPEPASMLSLAGLAGGLTLRRRARV